jgi:hypothetical protein
LGFRRRCVDQMWQTDSAVGRQEQRDRSGSGTISSYRDVIRITAKLDNPCQFDPSMFTFVVREKWRYVPCRYIG